MQQPVRITGLPVLSRDLIARGPFDPANMSVREARALWRAFRIDYGFTGSAPFTADGESNAKLALAGIATRGLTLAPQGASARWNTCAAAGVCTSFCVLMTAGRGRIPTVLRGRIARTEFLGAQPQAAVTLIADEVRKAATANAGGALVRLNVASDLEWERIAPALFDLAELGARFYDYSKLDVRARASIAPAAYRLVFSVSEAQHSERVAVDYMTTGGTAAVVFDVRKGQPLPATWHGFEVIDGDASDDRTADPAGVVVGLRAKGAAVGALTAAGFVKAAGATP